MYKALFYKEWLKTRRVFAVALAVGLLIAFYVVMEMKSAIASVGICAVWLNMIQKDVSMVTAVTYIPLLTGLATGIAQMAPEMSHKRLKLTLHLPCPHLKLTAMMLLTGIMELTVIFGLQLGAIFAYDATVLPAPLVERVFLTMLPWYIAGYCAYLFIAAICLEGTWQMRVFMGLTGIAVIMTMFLHHNIMGAYSAMIPILIILIFILAILSFGSVERFKEGLQD